MKTILNIFKRDIKKICSNSMALILVVGISVLPSLYAWFNIYANWDPYGSTGNMMVAVANLDKGTSIRGKEMNVGNQIVENLKGNSSIDWQFVSKEEALSGVKSSKYYAAIEIPKDFSSSLTSILSTEFVQPSIVYYANEKKNAIATKITDKVVQTVQGSVNESFITSVVDVLNSILGTVTQKNDSSDGNTVAVVLGYIDSIGVQVKSLKKAIDGFAQSTEIMDKLGEKFSEEKLSAFLTDTKSSVDNIADVITVTEASLNIVPDNIGTLINETVSSANKISALLNEYAKLGNTPEGKAKLEAASALVSSTASRLSAVSSILNNINSSLPTPIESVTIGASSISDASASLSALSDGIKATLNGNSKTTAAKLSETAKSISGTISTLSNDYNTKIKPQIKAATSSLVTTLNDASGILESANEAVPVLSDIVSQLSSSSATLRTVLVSFSSSLDTFTSQLDTLSGVIKSMTDSDSFNAMMNVISGNSKELGSFLSSPVTVTTEKVYSIDNYGSAMAPFYSTLAIWVGGIVLVAIMKTNVKKKKELGGVKPYEEFFGRAILFELIGIIQGLIICLGDLFFLKIQCYHPIKFILAGILAAMIFDLFIYSLTVAFGDIGKAIAVILLVIQLGGSGGTFPIDVCPRFFRVLHPFLPFTFVINAMRECICESFGGDYYFDLLKLLAYLAAALVIGLLVRIPLSKPIKFFNKKLEETDIM